MKASRGITSVLEQGISVISRSPSCCYTRLGEFKLEMLAEVANDARGRAENILRSASNTSVGKLVHADTGTITINPANSTETSSEGNNDTRSWEKDIITIAHVVYQVNWARAPGESRMDPSEIRSGGGALTNVRACFCGANPLNCGPERVSDSPQIDASGCAITPRMRGVRAAEFSV